MNLEDMELEKGEICTASGDVGGVTAAVPTELSEAGATVGHRHGASDDQAAVDPSVGFQQKPDMSVFWGENRYVVFLGKP
jgi:hypothetical protein